MWGILSTMYHIVFLTHWVKSVQIRSFLWCKYRKIRTRKNSVFEHFSRSDNNIDLAAASLKVSGDAFEWLSNNGKMASAANPLQLGFAFLYSLKTSENLKVF